MVKNDVWKTRLEKAINELRTETRPYKIKILQDRIANYNKKIENQDLTSNQISQTPAKYQVNSNELAESSQDRIQYKCSQEYNFNNQEIVSALKESIKQFYVNGSRSSAKLIALHSFINCIVNHKLMSLAPELYKDISIFSHPVKEIKVSGLIYKKNIDVTVKYKSRNIGIISVKFIMSNYSQNNVNYIESMIGECVNIKSTKNNRVFWHPIFIFNKIPYYDSNNVIKKIEKLNLNKYEKLEKYIENHRDNYNTLPDYVSITILNNTKDLHHPKKLKAMNMDIDTYISELIDSNDPIIAIDQHFGFIENMNMFCNKIISNITQISSSTCPNSSSSKSYSSSKS